MYSQTFSLVTYLDAFTLEQILKRHDKQVLFYEYIVHDKDVVEENGKAKVDDEGNKILKEKHIHCNIYLKNQQAEINVSKWFDREYDKQGVKINTLIQETKSTESAHDYLTHKNNPEKYQYNINEIIWEAKPSFSDTRMEAFAEYCAIRTKWSIHEAKERGEWEKDEKARSIVELCIEGERTRNLLKAYGRDYVYNRKKYLETAFDIALEEQNTKAIARLKNQLRIYDPADISKMEAEIAILTCQIKKAKEKYAEATGEELPFSNTDDFLDMMK